MRASQDLIWRLVAFIALVASLWVGLTQRDKLGRGFLIRGSVAVIGACVLSCSVAYATGWDFTSALAAPGDAFVFGSATAVGLTFVLTILNRNFGTVAAAGAVVGTFALSIAGSVANMLGVTRRPITDTLVVCMIVALSIIIVVLGVSRADRRFRNRQQLGYFWTVLGCVLVCAEYFSAPIAAETGAGSNAFALTLSFVLVPLLNMPFDWAALGLTRALLRRGLELGAWWPYALALVDAVLATGVISLLTVVTILGVQAFDDLIIRVAGSEVGVLSLDQLFRGIASRPAAPEYWWLYTILLSTMIPSLLNLMIGGASLLRGVPWITTALLRAMPVHRAPANYNRSIIALVLTAQMFLGGLLGIAAQGFLVYVVVYVVTGLLPAFGQDLLSLIQAVATPDLPGRLIAWLLGQPTH